MLFLAGPSVLSDKETHENVSTPSPTAIQQHLVEARYRKKMRSDLFWLRGLNEEDQENGWAELVPVNVPTDGNCLCHAASLSINGHEDHGLQLRMALYNHMVQYRSDIIPVYRQYLKKSNAALEMLTLDEWRKE